LHFFPEIGDQVLLAFDSGDIRHPIVVGSLWIPPADSSHSKSAQSLPSVKRLKTKQGHEITFQEDEENASIQIKTPGEQIILLDDAAHSILIQNQDGSQAIEINGHTGTITIQGTQAIRLKAGNISLDLDSRSHKAIVASESIQLEAAHSMTLKAPSMTIQATSLDISAASDLSLQAQGVASLKGAMVKVN
jgi:uncharacterized protein involved in type VI secretion and phage assembly